MDEMHTNAYQALQTALDSRDRGGERAYEAQHADEVTGWPGDTGRHG
jgi:hypothetical protein